MKAFFNDSDPSMSTALGEENMVKFHVQKRPTKCVNQTGEIEIS